MGISAGGFIKTVHEASTGPNAGEMPFPCGARPLAIDLNLPLGSNCRDKMTFASCVSPSALIAFLGADGLVLQLSRSWNRIVTNVDAEVGTSYLSMTYIQPYAPDSEPYFSGLQRVISHLSDRFNITYRSDGLGNLRWYKMQVSRLDASLVIVSIEDVTDAERIRETMDKLSHDLRNVQERERQHIAEELHNSTAQHLAAVSLNMLALRECAALPKRAGPIISRIGLSLDAAMRELRAVSYLLYPFNLDRDGLTRALARVAEDFSRRSSIDVDLGIPRAVNCLPLGLQRSLLRIVQEALANVYRHAEAGRVSIRAIVRRQGIVLCIADNGRGMPEDFDEFGPQAGIGIRGMQARALQWGARLKLRSVANRGTSLHVFVPRARIAGQ